MVAKGCGSSLCPVTPASAADFSRCSVPTSEIAHLISALVDDLEKEIRSPEDAEEVKVYDMNKPAVHSEKD